MGGRVLPKTHNQVMAGNGGKHTFCERFANLGGGGGFPPGPGFSAASPEPFGAHMFHDMPCHVSHLVSVCGTCGHLQVS